MSVHNIKGSTAVEISSSIEEGIRRGTLAPDAGLPTVRACARALDVSPATVASAYRRLRERGLILTRGRRGTVVSGQPPLPPRPVASLPEGALDLSVGNPDALLLPRLGPALAKLDPPRRLYGESLTDPDLIALCRRELDADGIPSAHCTIVSGALDGIDRVLDAHLRPGDRVVVEDPAFSGVLTLLQPAGLVAEPVPVDDAGLRPHALAEALERGPRALILTPRAQNPTGAALDAGRARALRRVLRHHPDVLVIEDDHMGAVCDAPAETLCRGRRHWVVARSFCKALGPDLRVALLAGDEETIARVEGRQLVGMRWVSHVLQQLVVALLAQKSVRAELRRAARIYSQRRDALLEALARHGIAASGRSGLNVWIPVPEESRVVSALLDAGYAVSAGERFRLRSEPAIRVTTAALEPADARAFAAALAAILGPPRRTLST